MVLIERDGTRKPVCGVCRKARVEREPQAGRVFICEACLENIHAQFKDSRAGGPPFVRLGVTARVTPCDIRRHAAILTRSIARALASRRRAAAKLMPAARAAARRLISLP